MRIESVRVYRMSLPLREAYHLSYGPVRALESVWVRVQLEDGHVGWGESTPLPGYADSDMEMVWGSSNRLADAWVGQGVDAVLGAPPRFQDGFLFCAVWTAVEDAAGLIPCPDGDVPLVGLVQERKGEGPDSALQRVRDQGGYKVFKVKVGFLSLEEDVERLHGFQQALDDNECLRIDANQSLSKQQASVLLAGCAPGKVELFEQPLPVEAWDDCMDISRRAPVPIMLDESITGLASLERASRSGARIVKLKWMKQGGLCFLREMVARARHLGLRVVLGNGVAGWIDNRHEAAFWLEYLQGMYLAGEMNGYLKVRSSAPFLGFSDGCLRLAARSIEDIDPAEYRPLDVRAYDA